MKNENEETKNTQNQKEEEKRQPIVAYSQEAFKIAFIEQWKWHFKRHSFEPNALTACLQSCKAATANSCFIVCCLCVIVYMSVFAFDYIIMSNACTHYMALRKTLLDSFEWIFLSRFDRRAGQQAILAREMQFFQGTQSYTTNGLQRVETKINMFQNANMTT